MGFCTIGGFGGPAVTTSGPVPPRTATARLMAKRIPHTMPPRERLRTAAPGGRARRERPPGSQHEVDLHAARTLHVEPEHPVVEAIDARMGRVPVGRVADRDAVIARMWHGDRDRGRVE